ncbi:MAG: hypothetical protein K0Q49_3 [Haloplasmataceae bacterium]|nr:hypothetical protein [Haloplasmataceae bacterium]
MGALVDLINIAIELYVFAIFIYSFLTFFPNFRDSKVYYYLAKICDPLINVFRFATVGTISFAPMLAMMFLLFLSEIMNYLYY